MTTLHSTYCFGEFSDEFQFLAGTITARGLCVYLVIPSQFPSRPYWTHISNNNRENAFLTRITHCPAWNSTKIAGLEGSFYFYDQFAARLTPIRPIIKLVVLHEWIKRVKTIQYPATHAKPDNVTDLWGLQGIKTRTTACKRGITTYATVCKLGRT